jgi:uncharacterized protein (TIGR02246 family)
MTASEQDSSNDVTEIRSLLQRWTEAVRRHDTDGVLADHDADIVMFDVPPPLQSKGIEEYRRTWDLFFRWHRPSDPFDVRKLEIIAGRDVAFAFALMRCGGTSESGKRDELDFRLTIGLRKIDGRWRIVHEHHSVPAVS